MLHIRRLVKFTLISILFLCLTGDVVWAGGDHTVKTRTSLKKSLGREHRREGVHDGNNVLTIFF